MQPNDIQSSATDYQARYDALLATVLQEPTQSRTRILCRYYERSEDPNVIEPIKAIVDEALVGIRESAAMFGIA